jgi:hypothetical protein
MTSLLNLTFVVIGSCAEPVRNTNGSVQTDESIMNVRTPVRHDPGRDGRNIPVSPSAGSPIAALLFLFAVIQSARSFAAFLRPLRPLRPLCPSPLHTHDAPATHKHLGAAGASSVKRW